MQKKKKWKESRIDDKKSQDDLCKLFSPMLIYRPFRFLKAGLNPAGYSSNELLGGGVM